MSEKRIEGPDTGDLQGRIAELGPWFHNLRLNGIETAPEHFLGDYPRAFYECFRRAIPDRLDGWSVLDVGCNAGFYAFEMKRRGAHRVVGIDSDPRYLAQARLAADAYGMAVEFRQHSVYDVGLLDGPFDLVLFMGVMYHLRHPLLALDLLRRHVGRLLVCQTMQRGSEQILPLRTDYDFTEQHIFDNPGFPKLHFVEHDYAHDDTNWWIPNRACTEAMLRSAGFRVVANPVSEVYLCEPGGPAAELPRMLTEHPNA